MRKIDLRLVGLVASLLAVPVASAQDLRGSPPLPPLPQIYETSEQRIRVVEIAGGLANPWSIGFLPNGDMLVTRARRLPSGRATCSWAR